MKSCSLFATGVESFCGIKGWSDEIWNGMKHLSIASWIYMNSMKCRGCMTSKRDWDHGKLTCNWHEGPLHYGKPWSKFSADVSLDLAMGCAFLELSFTIPHPFCCCICYVVFAMFFWGAFSQRFCRELTDELVTCRACQMQLVDVRQ